MWNPVGNLQPGTDRQRDVLHGRRTASRAGAPRCQRVPTPTYTAGGPVVVQWIDYTGCPSEPGPLGYIR